MARDVDYRPDSTGWRQIRNSREVQDACLSVAKQAQVFAEGISPVDSGDYVSSFSVEPVTVQFATAGEAAGPRAAAQLVNDSDHAAAVEWGKPPHRVLGRTLDHLAGPG